MHIINICLQFCRTDLALLSLGQVCAKISVNNKGLLTECKVCTGMYLPELFVQCEKTEGKYFPVQTEQTKLIRQPVDHTCSLHRQTFVFGVDVFIALLVSEPV